MALVSTGRHGGGRRASSGGPWTSTRRPAPTIASSPWPCRDRAGTTKPSSSSERPSAATPTSPASTPSSASLPGVRRGGTRRPSPITDRPSRSTRTTRRPESTCEPSWCGWDGRDEARVAWRRSLEADPPEHDAWYGYAEFCLFLGQEDEYRRARQDVLARFGATTDPHVAERTARACLLRPATEDELRQAVALAERAAAVEPSKYPGVYPLLPVRPGPGGIPPGAARPGDRVDARGRGELLGPAPRLVLAMALHRSGQAAEARQTLAAAVLAYDWRANQALTRTAGSSTCSAARPRA